LISLGAVGTAYLAYDCSGKRRKNNYHGYHTKLKEFLPECKTCTDKDKSAKLVIVNKISRLEIEQEVLTQEQDNLANDYIKETGSIGIREFVIKKGIAPSEDPSDIEYETKSSYLWGLAEDAREKIESLGKTASMTPFCKDCLKDFAGKEQLTN
jgi:hypothetical protein